VHFTGGLVKLQLGSAESDKDNENNEIGLILVMVKITPRTCKRC